MNLDWVIYVDSRAIRGSLLHAGGKKSHIDLCLRGKKPPDPKADFLVTNPLTGKETPPV